MKMTPEEARRTLDRLYQYVSTEVQQALDAADRALEKQIPKKPLNMGQLMWDYPLGNCPSCEEGVNGGMDYCDRCGTKLDWTKEKENEK